MRIDIITLFPEMCEAVLSESIIGRARKSGAIDIRCHQLRDYALDKHRRVDDTTYGGGMGMLMLAEPIALCYESICEQTREKSHLIYLSPKGETLTQAKLKELSQHDNVCLLCGHYEGVDQRVLDRYVDEEISIGDYVLTGGELPAMVVIDTVSRLIPGVLGNGVSADTDSFMNGLLEYPQYSRPEVWMGKAVPAVLLSGDHAKVDRWRKEQSLQRTKERRPDLYEKYMEEHPEAEKKEKKRK